MAGPNGSENPASILCPKCGAENRVGAALCFLCETDLTKIHQWPYLKKGEPLDELGLSLNPYAPPGNDDETGSRPDFVGPILLLGLGLICVCTIAIAPGLGVPLTIFVLLAAGGNAWYSEHPENRQPVGPGLKVAIFLSTLGMYLLGVVAFAIAVGTALFAICACQAGGQPGAPGNLQAGGPSVWIFTIVGVIAFVITIGAIIGLSRIRPRR